MAGGMVVAWTAVVLVFWWGLFVPSMRSDVDATVAIDLWGYFFPKYVYAARALGNGGLFWNPYEFAGFPFLGAGQPAVLYPLRWAVYAAVTPDLAPHVFMVVHYVLLGAGSWVVLRVLHRSRLGAALGALVVSFQPFMLNGHYAPHWISNFVWVPWIVAGFVRLLERPQTAAAVGPMLGLTVALACELLAGYPEYVLDTAIVLAILWVFAGAAAVRTGDLRRFARGTAWAIGAGLLAALLTAVAWVPLFEGVRMSFRAGGDVQFMFGMLYDPARFGSGLRGLVAGMTQLFYLPPFGWACLLIGFAAPHVPYRWSMLAIALLCNAATSVLRTVPPFSFFRGPLCWSSILHLPLAALAAAGFDAIRAARRDGTPTLFWRWGPEALGLLLAPLCSMRAVAWMVAGFTGLRVGRAAPVLLVLAPLGAVWTWLPAGKPTDGLVHHFSAGVPTFPTLGRGTARSAALRGVCPEGGRVVAPEDTWVGTNLLGLVPTPQGYPESLAPERMSHVLEAAGLAPHTVFPLDWLRVAESRSTLELLDVRCIVADPQHAAAAARAGFERGAALPDGRVAFTRDGQRAALVGRSVVAADGTAALAAVRSADFRFTDQVVLETPAEGGVGANGTATPDGPREPGAMRWRTDAPNPAWLVVSENWYPGWRATVDDVPAPVVRGDYTLLAVAVPAGRHRVALWYRPLGFDAALGATALGGGLAVALAGLLARVRSRMERGA